jgi:hypothetical protein
MVRSHGHMHNADTCTVYEQHARTMGMVRSLSHARARNRSEKEARMRRGLLLFCRLHGVFFCRVLSTTMSASQQS